MLGDILAKVFANRSKKAVLAKYQINLGMLEPKYERLEDLEIVRGLDLDGLPENLTLWDFRFESHEFRLVMNPSEHVLDPDPFGRGRLVAAFGKKVGEKSFEPLNERFWFRQMDSLRTLMPELDRLYPPS